MQSYEKVFKCKRYSQFLGAYLTCKIVEFGEEVGVNLLKAFDSSRLHILKQATLNEGIGFLLALSVEGVVAINEPVEEIGSPFAWNRPHQLDDIVL